MFGKVEEDAKEKRCFDAVDLKSAFRSNVFSKSKEGVRESLKMTLWPACRESVE